MIHGLSWGHRRATAPLKALSKAFASETGQEVIWLDRTLADFEHQGMAAAAEGVDLLVYDHPFSGDIAANGALVPLDDLTMGRLAPGRTPDFIGPSLHSYRYEGAIYGVPVDGATMHAITRPDLLCGSAPATWGEAIELGREARRAGRYVALPWKTPHAGLALASLLENLAPAWQPGRAEDQPFFDRPQLEEGLDLIRQLAELCPPQASGWNAIDLHDAMQARDNILFAPCVYGYATYGETLGDTPRLGFAPFAGVHGSRGAILGGTALGLTRQGAESPAAAEFLRFCLDLDRQTEMIGSNHGQPAAAASWRDARLDERFNGFFGAALDTVVHSSIRPRWPGYVALQRRVGNTVQLCLDGGLTVAETLRDVREAEAKVRGKEVMANG